MKEQFLAAVKGRRTIYGISKEATVSDDRLVEVIQEAVKHTPSAFHSQSARVIVLLGQQHDKLWDITKEALRKVVPPENFTPTEAKINSFRAGYGSILYFEDMTIVETLQNKFPTYKENFPLWSQQSSGMLQFVIWTALAAEGLGASLQHYNPLIDDEVKKEWDIPGNWKLIAQMPFGKPTGEPDAKEFQPLETRMKVYK
jgi:predicted oxidoreductase (fatty acid repression mutant protein)